jgi:hypothetical protein
MENGKKFVCSGVVVLAIVALFVGGCGVGDSGKDITMPKVYKQEHIERVAVLSFGNDNFTDKLIEKLVDNSKWQVIDRVNLDRILKEQNLQQTQQFDKDTAVEVGKIAGVDLVIFGDYRGTYDIAVVKAIDVSTGEYLAYKVADLSNCYEEDMDCRADVAATALLPHRISNKGIEINPPKPKKRGKKK